MDTSESEGLGGSVVLYVGAVLGVLAVLAVPVYLANAPEVYENPRLQRADPLLNGPIIGNRAAGGLPVALLKRPDIIDPATLALLQAKAKKQTAAARPSPPRAAQRPTGTPMADLQAERPRRPSFFLFNLFGG